MSPCPQGWSPWCPHVHKCVPKVALATWGSLRCPRRWSLWSSHVLMGRFSMVALGSHGWSSSCPHEKVLHGLPTSMDVPKMLLLIRSSPWCSHGCSPWCSYIHRCPQNVPTYWEFSMVSPHPWMSPRCSHLLGVLHGVPMDGSPWRPHACPQEAPLYQGTSSPSPLVPPQSSGLP